jgi:hypothetical protein
MRYVDEADRAMECTENSPCPHACVRLGFRLWGSAVRIRLLCVRIGLLCSVCMPKSPPCSNRSLLREAKETYPIEKETEEARVHMLALTCQYRDFPPLCTDSSPKTIPP